MKIKLLVILILCIASLACKQSKSKQAVSGLTIDPKIKTEAEKHISTSPQFDALKTKMSIYLNSGEIQGYENDSLIAHSKFELQQAPFKSFYLWKNDTLSINGGFGLFGGVGFVINIAKNNATLYHMLSSDEYPTYCYNENDSLIYRLEVPCTDTKIVLSEIPDSTKKQIIYGYVEFKSAVYYASSGSADGQEILPRQKLKANMKLYFKSSYSDFND